MEYLTELVDDGYRRYPTTEAHVVRDQSVRAADELIWVVITDIVDIAQSSGLLGTAIAAVILAEQAARLWPDGKVDGWLPGNDPDASEKLQGILQEAEQLDGIQIDWNGDAGIVTVTLADKWEEMPKECPHCGALFIACNGECDQ